MESPTQLLRTGQSAGVFQIRQNPSTGWEEAEGNCHLCTLPGKLFLKEKEKTTKEPKFRSIASDLQFVTELLEAGISWWLDPGCNQRTSLKQDKGSERKVEKYSQITFLWSRSFFFPHPCVSCIRGWDGPNEEDKEAARLIRENGAGGGDRGGVVGTMTLLLRYSADLYSRTAVILPLSSPHMAKCPI